MGLTLAGKQNEINNGAGAYLIGSEWRFPHVYYHDGDVWCFRTGTPRGQMIRMSHFRALERHSE